jgi:hypothetical protein
MVEETINGGLAHVFQCEISILNGSYVYDEDFKPESCLGFGEGLIDKESVKKLYIYEE